MVIGFQKFGSDYTRVLWLTFLLKETGKF